MSDYTYTMCIATDTLAEKYRPEPGVEPRVSR